MTEEREELHRLRREVRRLLEECEFLEKCNGLVGSGDGPGRGSRFMRAHEAESCIATTACVLGSSTSGYLGSLKRPRPAREKSDSALA